MAIDIPVRTAHRAADTGEEPIVFIELQYDDYSGEDDIERQIGTSGLRRVSASRSGRRPTRTITSMSRRPATKTDGGDDGTRTHDPLLAKQVL
jgi:hypothetical protein